MKKIFLVLFLLSQSLLASTNQDGGTWLGLFNRTQNNKVGSFAIWNELQLRFNTDVSGMQQLLFRPGVIYQYNQNNDFGLLLGYINTKNFAKDKNTNEYRFTLQHQYYQTFGEGNKITFRSRLEHRFLEQAGPLDLRFREMIRYSKNLTPKTQFVIWDEPFLNFNRPSWVYDSFFERNRFFIGTNIQVGTIKLEVGYLNQYIPHKGADTMEHILLTYFIY